MEEPEAVDAVLVAVVDVVDVGVLVEDFGGGVGPALSKYLSNAAFALAGGPKGVAPFSFSPVFDAPPPILSLLADRALCINLLAVDILLVVDCLLATDAELISEPEPNSLSSLMFLSLDLLVIFLSFPSSPLLFFFSPGSHSLCVDCMLSLDPVDSRSTLVSRSSRRIVMAL